jgi:hypothetical protein
MISLNNTSKAAQGDTNTAERQFLEEPEALSSPRRKEDVSLTKEVKNWKEKGLHRYGALWETFDADSGQWVDSHATWTDWPIDLQGDWKHLKGKTQQRVDFEKV